MVNQNLEKRTSDAINNRLKDSRWNVQKNNDLFKLLGITVRKIFLHNDVTAEKSEDDQQNIKRGNRH